jgi:hypothetical protein
MNNSKFELHRQKSFANEIVLVDGPTRAGKSLIHPILSSYKNVEILTSDNLFENVAYLYHNKKIECDAAVSLLRCQLQMRIYYTMLSRNVNFKTGDYSGVFWNVNPLRYFKRLFFLKDKDVLEAIIKEKPLVQIQTHDALSHIDILFKSFDKGLKIIEMIRNPVGLIYSNYAKGYGERESKEPTKIMFTIKYKDDILPWYAHGWEDQYLSMSRMDRVIHYISRRLENIYTSYNNLNDIQKSQILFVPYEKFLTSPSKYLIEIGNLISREPTKLTKRALSHAGCPANINDSDLKDKTAKIKALCTKESFHILSDLLEFHHNFASKH